jgi:hypothetical protein
VATIILVSDLPTALQSADMIDAMVDGANARASRVAPCLTNPTSTAWAATTAYAVDDQVRLAEGQFLQVTTAGTSGATIPAIPSAIGDDVEDGTVTWERIAPSPDQIAEAKLILLGAVKRWAEAGAGAFQSQTAGPFGVQVDTRQRTGFNLWPTEIEGLQEICASGTDSSSGAFSITPSGRTASHMPWCSLMLGAAYCSCGADLTDYQYPLYEGGVLSGDEY